MRTALLFCASAASGVAWRDLALYYDGHVYILISQSFPFLYTGISSIFPLFKESPYFTGWFPLYPLFIRIVEFAAGDPRLAALLVSQASASLAVVFLYRLAGRFLERPILPALFFAALPPTWLLTGSLSFAEPLFICLFLAAIDRFLADDRPAAVVLGCLVVLAQKTGVLLLPILALTHFWDRGLSGMRRMAPYLLCLAPILLLQSYLYFTFGDFFANIRIQREIVADSFFKFPFQSFLTGLFSPKQIFQGHFWLRKLMIAASALFYVCVLTWAWRNRSEKNRILICWLGVVLLFYASIGGGWSFYTFPRFMTLGAPAAFLLAFGGLEKMGKPLVHWLALLAVAAPAAVAVGVLDVVSATEFMQRIFPPGYFSALADVLGGLVK